MKLYLLQVQWGVGNEDEYLEEIGIFESVELAKDYVKKTFSVDELKEVSIVESALNSDFFSLPCEQREEYIWIFESGKLLQTFNMKYCNDLESLDDLNKRNWPYTPDAKLEW